MLTQDQWYQKIRKFVPSWVFEKEKYSVAVFQAMAAVFAGLDQDAQDQFNATFVTRSSSPVEDLMGDERNIKRLPGENNAAYAIRIQRITNFTDHASIIRAVDSLLLRPGAKMREAPEDSPYANRQTCANRDMYLCDFHNDFFTIVVPNQVHQPYSFVSRAVYGSRGNYVGTLTAPDMAFDSVVAIVNALKAFGVMFRLIESINSTVL